ncbi:hypothetical protein BW39_00541 [Delftia sp. RIT313]|nr:hypothetical protein BW39_00541 [Delftia sp. RIT313]
MGLAACRVVDVVGGQGASLHHILGLLAGRDGARKPCLLDDAAIAVVLVGRDRAGRIGAPGEAAGAVVGVFLDRVGCRAVLGDQRVDGGAVVGVRAQGDGLGIAHALHHVARRVIAQPGHRARAVGRGDEAAHAVVDHAGAQVARIVGHGRGEGARRPAPRASDADAVGVAALLLDAAIAVAQVGGDLALPRDHRLQVVVGVVAAVFDPVAGRGGDARHHLLGPGGRTEHRAVVHIDLQVEARERVAVFGQSADAAQCVVAGFLDAACAIDGQDLAVLAVVQVVAGVAVGVHTAGDVAACVIGVASREVQAAGVDLLLGATARRIVGVARERAFGAGDFQRMALGVVAVARGQGQACGVHDLLEQLALGVVAQLGDGATGLGDADLAAQWVVGVLGGQRQAGGVHGAREHAVGRIVGDGGARAVGVHGLDQPAGLVVGLGGGRRLHDLGVVQPGRGRRARGLAVGIEGVGGQVALGVGDADLVAMAVVGLFDQQAFARGDRDGACLGVVGVAGGAAFGVDLCDDAAEGIVGGGERGPQRVGAADFAAQPVVGAGARVAQRIRGADLAAEGVVGGGRGEGQLAGIAHLARGQAAPVVGGLDEGAGGARASGFGALRLFAEGVVDVVAREAQRIALAGQGAVGVVGVLGGLVLGGIGGRLQQRLQRAVDQAACQRSRQRARVDARAVAHLCAHLAQRVVARLGHFTQRVDGVRELILGVVEEQGAQAVGIGGAGAPAGCIVGVAAGVAAPDGLDLGGGLGCGQLACTLGAELGRDPAQRVVAHLARARLGGACSHGAGRAVAGGVVAVLGARALPVGLGRELAQLVVFEDGGAVLGVGGRADACHGRGAGERGKQGRCQRRGIAGLAHELAGRVVAEGGEVAGAIHRAGQAALAVVHAAHDDVLGVGGGHQLGQRACGALGGVGRVGKARGAGQAAGGIVIEGHEVAFGIQRSQNKAICAVELPRGAVGHVGGAGRGALAERGPLNAT